MQNLETILAVTATAVGLLITAVTFLMKFLKSGKAKKAAEGILQISNAVLPYIKQAEELINYSGEEKKDFVMAKANQFAAEIGVPFDAEQVSAKIEELILLTKTVNERPQDKLSAVSSKKSHNMRN